MPARKAMIFLIKSKVFIFNGISKYSLSPTFSGAKRLRESEGSAPQSPFGGAGGYVYTKTGCQTGILFLVEIALLVLNTVLSAVNTGNFCPVCGAQKPEPATWTCSCGAVNTGKFCPECGKALYKKEN